MVRLNQIAADIVSKRRTQEYKLQIIPPMRKEPIIDLFTRFSAYCQHQNQKILCLCAINTMWCNSLRSSLPALALLMTNFMVCTPKFKGGFFSESAMCFSNLQISKNKMFQNTILNLKFKFPANISKQRIQISSSG